jgi:hypothetical protein
MRTRSIALACILSSGCIVEAPTESGSSSSAPARRPPAQPRTFKTGAILGEDKVELTGASVTPGEVTPGDQVRVSAFFRVIDKLDADYTVFVHVEDAEGRMQRMLLDHVPAGGQYPTTQWKPGETVRDDFIVALPSGVAVSRLNVWVGLWDPKTDLRLPLKNKDKVTNDGNNRILLAQIPVGAY